MTKTLKIVSLLITYLCLNACSTIQTINHIDAQKLSMHDGIYQNIAHTPWPALSTNQNILAKTEHLLIPEIRNRLIALEDLPPNTSPQNIYYYDKLLNNAVKQFQYRHGLNSDGVIGQSTLNYLNVSPSERLRQIRMAQTQWNALSTKTNNNDYLHINLSSYLLNIYHQGEKKLTMNIVVGSKNWPTPQLESEIQSVVINPRWNIPRNITEKEIIHKIAQNINYLKEENITIVDGWHKGAKNIDPLSIDWQSYTGDKDLPFRLVQGAGDDNALGNIKFTFPNSEHIYLHDTPNKSVFTLENRNLSHGCVRLEHPLKLLTYLFEYHHLTNEEKIISALAEKKQTRHYALSASLPIYITHINTWVDQKGLIHFKD